MRKMIASALAAIACVAAMVTPASAGKLYISEYNSIGVAFGGTAQIAVEPPIAIQTPVDFSTGAARSAPFGAATSYIMITCDEQCSYLVGSSPTATTSNMPLGAYSPLFIQVRPGMSISAVAHP